MFDHLYLPGIKGLKEETFFQILKQLGRSEYVTSGLRAERKYTLTHYFVMWSDHLFK